METKEIRLKNGTVKNIISGPITRIENCANNRELAIASLINNMFKGAIGFKLTITKISVEKRITYSANISMSWRSKP